MPVFLIERRFAEDLEASAEVNDRIKRINEEEGVRWLYSFLSADKRDKRRCRVSRIEAGAGTAEERAEAAAPRAMMSRHISRRKKGLPPV